MGRSINEKKIDYNMTQLFDVPVVPYITVGFWCPRFLDSMFPYSMSTSFPNILIKWHFLEASVVCTFSNLGLLRNVHLSKFYKQKILVKYCSQKSKLVCSNIAKLRYCEYFRYVFVRNISIKRSLERYENQTTELHFFF